MAVLGIVAADAAARRITTRHIRSTNGFAYRQLLLLSEVLLITLQLMQRLKKKSHFIRDALQKLGGASTRAANRVLRRIFPS